MPQIHPKVRAFQFFSIEVLVDGFDGHERFSFKFSSSDDLFRRPLKLEAFIDVGFQVALDLDFRSAFQSSSLIVHLSGMAAVALEADVTVPPEFSKDSRAMSL